jgi:AraC-like DNA-binding protein
MFAFLERTPPAPLDGHIRCVWLLRSDASGGDMPIVPDGSVEIVLNLGDPVDELQGDVAVRQPRAMLVGQPRRPVVVRPSGALRMVGIRLQPWASRSFMPLPAAELADRSVDLASLGAPGVATLMDALHGLTADDAHLDAVCTWLAARLRGVAAAPRFVPEAVRIIRRRRELPSVRALAGELGVTTRTLQRAFAQDVGFGPKVLQRITRVQRAIGLSRIDERLPWAAIAARVGYFDEAHLNLDFHAFTGSSPSRFAPRAETLTELMLEAGGRAR